MQTGQPEMSREVTAADLAAHFDVDWVRAAGLGSFISVPLKGRGTVGALTLASRAPVSAIYSPNRPGSRERYQPPPTSGKRPMPVSGVASSARL